MLEREEAPGASEPGLHLVADEQRAVLAAGRLRAREIALRREVDALALDRLDDERGDVARGELRAQRVEVAERHARSPGTNGPKPSRKFSSPLSESEPSVRPWKACSA